MNLIPSLTRPIRLGIVAVLALIGVNTIGAQPNASASATSTIPTISGTPAAWTVGGQWLNSKPLTPQSLRGKVVLVNFWVYSCINCHNSLPTLKQWYKDHRQAGLEIVGIHTPEFESDKPMANVQQALKRDGVTWPVMQDNNFATWNAYNNQYWPAFYLIDRAGKLRFYHAGEISDRYPQAIPGLSAAIAQLLAEQP
jgi:thiol-disulfide isomerase/thioredoxin